MNQKPLAANFAGKHVGRILTKEEVEAVSGGDLTFTVSNDDLLTNQPPKMITVDSDNWEVDD